MRVIGHHRAVQQRVQHRVAAVTDVQLRLPVSRRKDRAHVPAAGLLQSLELGAGPCTMTNWRSGAGPQAGPPPVQQLTMPGQTKPRKLHE